MFCVMQLLRAPTCVIHPRHSHPSPKNHTSHHNTKVWIWPPMYVISGPMDTLHEFLVSPHSFAPPELIPHLLARNWCRQSLADLFGMRGKRYDAKNKSCICFNGSSCIHKRCMITVTSQNIYMSSHYFKHAHRSSLLHSRCTGTRP